MQRQESRRMRIKGVMSVGERRNAGREESPLAAATIFVVEEALAPQLLR